MRLERLVVDSARNTPDATAVRTIGERASYAQLDQLGNRIAHALSGLGVGRGARVALWLDKSIETVAAMQAILRLGAAYVPLDPGSPVKRIRKLLADCAPAALISTRARAESVSGGASGALPCLTVDGACAGGPAWDDVLRMPDHQPLTERARAELSEHDPAFILYTSGSTGEPKGVCISHANAWAFVEWAAHATGAHAGDRFSNHAPLHFDLSVFDLYTAFLVGAQVSLIPALVAYMPDRLVAFMAEHAITVWYSVPSALVMMLEHGALKGRDDIEPRVLVFAGEAFPVPPLRRLRALWPDARFFNFYGPTETNVCTAYELARDSLERMTTVPIGTAASGDRVWLLAETGQPPAPGEPGVLWVHGPSVMLGYFGREPQAGRPYCTGDLARWNSDGQLEFLGRRDHMVKVHGHRVELGEVENLLLEHPDVREAAVLVQGSGRHARLVGFLCSRTDARPSLLELKRRCADELPPYAVIQCVHWLDALPRTGNGKLDRRALAALLEPPPLSSS